MRRIETDRREHRQQRAEKIVADPLPLRPGPFLALREHDAFARERGQHHLVQQLVLLRDQSVGLLAHRLEHLGRAASVGARIVQAELDALLQPGDADLEEFVAVGRDDGEEAQPLEQRHRLVRRMRHNAAVERVCAELLVDELGGGRGRGKVAGGLRGFARQGGRAVGTNALRIAKNSGQFLREARSVLGFPIEVISGREEARLIYLGVAHSLPVSQQRRLVVDVGGGSTEFIIGTGLEPQLTESLYMGCLSFSFKYFPDGKVDKSGMKAAVLGARQELAGIVHAYRAAGWDEAVGSSGTARSLENILRENGFAEEGLTREGLERLRAALIKHEKADPDKIAGLRPNRAPVLPGGLAIMSAVLDELGIEAMKVSERALRHGVLYDL